MEVGKLRDRIQLFRPVAGRVNSLASNLERASHKIIFRNLGWRFWGHRKGCICLLVIAPNSLILNKT